MSTICLTATSLALEITLDSPEEVEIEEKFIVSIDADSQDTYDIKIFVHNSEDQKIERSEYISEIENGGWKDPWYYLNAVFPGQKEFEIRILDSPVEKICAKFRKTDTKSVSTECNSIKLSTESKEVEEKNEEEQEIGELTEPPIDKIKEEVEQLSNTKDNEKILLNPPSETKEQIKITTKTSKKHTGIVYGFLAFCIILIILLALKRL